MAMDGERPNRVLLRNVAIVKEGPNCTLLRYADGYDRWQRGEISELFRVYENRLLGWPAHNYDTYYDKRYP